MTTTMNPLDDLRLLFADFLCLGGRITYNYHYSSTPPKPTLSNAFVCVNWNIILDEGTAWFRNKNADWVFVETLKLKGEESEINQLIIDLVLAAVKAYRDNNN